MSFIYFSIVFEAEKSMGDRHPKTLRRRRWTSDWSGEERGVGQPNRTSPAGVGPRVFLYFICTFLTYCRLSVGEYGVYSLQLFFADRGSPAFEADYEPSRRVSVLPQRSVIN